MQPIIAVEGLRKSFQVAQREPGVRGTLRHLLRRRYRQVDAVQDLQFSIAPGEMVGFLGPNGAGKTTTLKMLSGLIHPSAGRIEVAGYEPRRRQHRFLQEITLVMGNRQQLIWDLTPMQSLEVNAAVYDIEPLEAQQRIRELGQMLELDEELHRPVRKLSLGQRMKAELLAALLHRPSVLFLDEPTLGLDVNAQARVRDFLSDYNRRFGATVLLTSHYMGDITALCDRVLLIHEGRLFHDGSLDALVGRLCPFRDVRLELRRSIPSEALTPYGQLEEHSGHQARLRIARSQLTQQVSALLARFDIVDLEVSDPPIEELIGSLFERGQTTVATTEGQQ